MGATHVSSGDPRPQARLSILVRPAAEPSLRQNAHLPDARRVRPRQAIWSCRGGMGTLGRAGLKRGAVGARSNSGPEAHSRAATAKDLGAQVAKIHEELRALGIDPGSIEEEPVAA